MLGSEVAIRLSVQLLQLTQFFCQRHLGEQDIDLLFGVGLPLSSSRDDQCKQRETENQARYLCDSHLHILTHRELPSGKIRG